MKNKILNTNQRMKNTEIGEIPEEWEVMQISEVCTVNPNKREIAEILLSVDDAIEKMQAVIDQAQILKIGR